MSYIIRKLIVTCLALFVSFQFLAGATVGSKKMEMDESGRPLWLEGVIWVKVKPNVLIDADQLEISSFNVPSLDSKIKAYGIQSVTRTFKPLPHPELKNVPDLTRIFTLELPANASAKGMVAVFSQDPNVVYAERVPALYPTATPSDEFYADIMYHLPQIQAEDAWDIHKGENGTQEIIVGICDTGVDWKHPDLAANIYNRLAEDADGDGVTMVWDSLEAEWVMDPDDLNGIDDDNNGYIDDLIGWNFMADPEGHQNNNPTDPPNRGHGSHCAGLAAGVTDNSIGIASISWNVKILPSAHSYTEDGGQYIYRGYSGLVYLADNGADIISASWGGGGYSQSAEAVVRYVNAVGSIFVSSAGNEDDGSGGMRGFGPRYPTAYTGCISVASVSRTDNKAWYSSFGWYVDVSAPGGNHNPGLLSTVPYGNGYDYYSGTSMAGPVAAGMFALVKSYHPDWSNDEIIGQVLGTTDNIDGINPFYENWLGLGRINAFRALSEENVILPDEMELVLWDVDHSNHASEDWVMEPGQSTDLTFQLRNYAHLVGDSSVTFSLGSNDPHVLIQNPSLQDTIFPDDYVDIGAFSIDIAEEANTEVAKLWLAIQPQTAEVITGDTLNFDLLINTTSLDLSHLDLELYLGDIDTSYVTIHNSADASVIIDAMATSVDPNSLLWHVSENNAYEGYSWWCGDPDLGGYPDDTYQFLDLPVIDLSASNNPELSFMADWYIEDPGGADPPFDGWDGANVWISTDGGANFEVIEPLSPAYTCTALAAWGDYWDFGMVPGWAGDNNGYVEASFDLSDYISEEVVIRFGFAADGAANGTGMFIDNILVHDDTTTLFENDGVFAGGIRLDGFPSEDMPTPWLTFPNADNPVPGNGDFELEIVTNTTVMGVGYHVGAVQVMHANRVLGEINIIVDVSNSPVQLDPVNIPLEFALQQNYPNPFNPGTTIEYALPVSADVTIEVFDLKGRLVSQPLSAYQSPGYYAIDWQARDLNGRPLGTGIYLARIRSADFTDVIRMVYLK